MSAPGQEAAINHVEDAARKKRDADAAEAERRKAAAAAAAARAESVAAAERRKAADVAAARAEEEARRRQQEEADDRRRQAELKQKRQLEEAEAEVRRRRESKRQADVVEAAERAKRRQAETAAAKAEAEAEAAAKAKAQAEAEARDRQLKDAERRQREASERLAAEAAAQREVEAAASVADGAPEAGQAPSKDDLVAALNALRRGHEGDAAGLVTCLTTLRTYIQNLAKNPMEPKFQRISCDNAAFQKRVAAYGGAVEVLLACGFAREGNALAVPAALLKTKGPRFWDALAKVDVVLDRAREAAAGSAAPAKSSLA